MRVTWKSSEEAGIIPPVRLVRAPVRKRPRSIPAPTRDRPGGDEAPPAGPEETDGAVPPSGGPLRSDWYLQLGAACAKRAPDGANRATPARLRGLCPATAFSSRPHFTAPSRALSRPPKSSPKPFPPIPSRLITE